LDELPKNVVAISPISKNNFISTSKQMNANTPKHSKSKGINFH
jgi:hypothetical protein